MLQTHRWTPDEEYREQCSAPVTRRLYGDGDVGIQNLQLFMHALNSASIISLLIKLSAKSIHHLCHLSISIAEKVDLVPEAGYTLGRAHPGQS